MLKLNYFREFQTLAEFLAQLYSKEAEIFRYRAHLISSFSLLDNCFMKNNSNGDVLGKVVRAKRLSENLELGRWSI